MSIWQTDMLGPRSSRRRRAGGAVWWRIILLFFVGLIVGGVLYSVAVLSMAVGEVSDPLPPDLPQEVRPQPVQLEQQPVNILLMGLDNDRLRSDVMMLISVDPKAKKVGILQIPRDTRAVIAGKDTVEKINSAYAYGVRDRQFPANLRALKSVESLLHVTIHYTAVVDLTGFEQIVDKIGGVWVDIPRTMDYDDPEQDLHIHFQPGRQKLDGKQALEFVRWRRNNDGTGYPNGDLGRIRTQQLFLGSLVEEILKPGNLLRLPNTIAEASTYVDSTLEMSRLLSLAKLAAGLSTEDVEFATLPGTDAYMLDPESGNRLSFYVHDPEATARLVDRLIRGVDPEAAAGLRLQVVGNGEAARVAALVERLRRQGFVVEVASDAAEPPGKTRVVGLSGDDAGSQLVGRSLVSQGLEIEIVSQPAGQTEFDVRIELGKEFWLN